MLEETSGSLAFLIEHQAGGFCRARQSERQGGVVHLLGVGIGVVADDTKGVVRVGEAEVVDGLHPARRVAEGEDGRSRGYGLESLSIRGDEGVEV